MKVKYNKARRHLAGAALLALSAALPAHADYQSTVLSQGPVGYWRLNETTPPQVAVTTAANSGSLGATGNGTYEGSQGFFRGATGALANGTTAAHFDGSSQDVLIPYNAALNPATFSVEAWVNADASSANCVLASGHFASPRSGWLIYQNAAVGYNLRMYNQNGTAVSLDISSTGGSVVGNWNHLAVTFDGTTAKMYINGVMANSGTPTSYIPGTDGAFAVGMRSDAGFRWAGKADEVAYYNTVLSAGDIATHYGAASTNAAGYGSVILANSPLVYLPLNEPGDSLASNLGSLGSAGTAVYASGSYPAASGPRSPTYPGFEAGNNAVSFYGTNGSVALPALKLATNTVTMCGWIKANGAQPLAAGLMLSRSGTTVAGLTIDAVYGGLGIGYNWNNDAVSYNWSPAADSGFASLPDNDWAYVALVVQPTQAALYLCDRVNFANFAGVTNTTPHANQAFEGVTQLGADSLNASRYFNGSIDDVAVFNRALGVGELYTQYGAAVGNVPVRVFNDPQVPVDPVFEGDALVLKVDAGGTPNLTYQWRKDSSPIAGATTSALSKAAVALADAGSYDCVVGNSFGSATSGAASISVNSAQAPAVVTAPAGRTLYINGSLTLSVVGSGGGLRYQWSKGGAAITGATKSSYVIPVVVATNSGSYTVSISNAAGNATGGPAVVTVLTPANTYETAIVADKPQAWFRMNETSATTLLDSMGRHDGYYTNESASGNVTVGAAGAIVGSSDKAVTFDGTTKVYGYVPYSSLLNAQTFTIECWAKTSVMNADMCPVSSRSAVPQGYWLRTYPNGSWSGGVSQSGASYYVPSATAGDGIIAGQWKHVVMVYDTSLKVYVNGQWDGVGYVNFERNAAAPLLIGALNGTSIGNLFNGQIDEVLVYTNGLTLAQVQNHYSKALFPVATPPFWLTVPRSQEVVENPAATVTLTAAADGPIPITYQWYKNGAVVTGATSTALNLSCTSSNAASYYLRASNGTGSTNSPTAAFAVVPAGPAFVNVTNGLVMHLKFDGDYADASGRGNAGTAVGAPSFVPGKFGSALFYSTSNSIPSVNYVTLGKPTDLNFGASTDFSVSYWVKHDVGQTNGDLPFLCSATNSYGNAGITFAPSYMRAGWSYSLNGSVQVYGGDATLVNGDWHHLLHTFTRTGAAVTYLDGVQVDSRPCSAAGNLDSGGVWNIGQDPTGLYTEDGSATIDDLAVWRRALTQYEAYAIHYAATNSNSSFDVPGTVKLNASVVAGKLVLTWAPGSTLGTLLQADDVNGPWTAVGAYSPHYEVAPSAAKKFYRVSFIE